MTPAQETEYRNTRALVADALRRADPVALDVAVDLHKSVLADIRATIQKEAPHG